MSKGVGVYDMHRKIYLNYAKQLCAIHVFTPFDLTVEWYKRVLRLPEVVEASIKSWVFALCRAHT